MKVQILVILLSISIIGSLSLVTNKLTVSEKADPTDAPHLLWPATVSYTYGTDNLTIGDPCNFSFEEPLNEDVDEIFILYRQYMFFEAGCSAFPNTTKTDTTDKNSILTINVTNTTSLLMNLDTDESYNLTVQEGSFSIQANSYVGALRGLETFSQLISTSTDAKGKATVSIVSTPVIILDYPRFAHRAFSLDTARHFISKAKIFQILDGMMFTKLNVFHWHLSDSDSVPFFFPSHPNLTKFGAYSSKQVFSQQDIQDIVSYAKLRGIRIIPELDSPAHVGGWAGAPEAALLINCTDVGQEYNHSRGSALGQINPTKDESYNLVKDLLNDLNDYFPWEFIHLGADEVDEYCWNNTEIYEFMKTNKLEGFPDLFNYYVKRQKELVNPNKTKIYWLGSETLFLEFEPEDIIQWWGNTTALFPVFDQFPKNRFIVSNYDHFYLDCGFGNYFGNASWCDPMHTWLDIYRFELNATGFQQHEDQIFGVEACLFTELVNDANVLDRVFPRVTALAERVWTPETNEFGDTLMVVRRINAWIERNNDRGVPTGSLTCGFCEKNPDKCFV